LSEATFIGDCSTKAILSRIAAMPRPLHPHFRSAVVLRRRRGLSIAGGLLGAATLAGVFLLARLFFFLEALQAVTL
jgi:hypothetical protein